MKKLLRINKEPIPSDIPFLSEQHLDLINLLQEFHSEFGLAPSQKAFINYINAKHPRFSVDSITFLELFPEGIAQACMIARVPPSPRCF